MEDEYRNGWKRLGIAAALIVALVTVLANWTTVLEAGGVTPQQKHDADVRRLERRDQRIDRVLRCLLRADPRQGPAIRQCDGDPLEGQ